MFAAISECSATSAPNQREKATPLVCDFQDRACYFDTSKIPSNEHDVHQPPPPHGIGLADSLSDS
jgi:hypothetical protein